MPAYIRGRFGYVMPVAVSFVLVGLAVMPDVSASDARKPRARDLGVPFDGTPGNLNAITDVAGVEVGHETIIRGEGKLVVGRGPVRTGVTAVLPRGKKSLDPVFAAWFSLNGNGEMTGTTWVEESGLLEGPVMITNTHSVGVVRDAVVEWLVRRDPNVAWALPVVAETYDGFLNDINGFHVRKSHAFRALDGAKSGPVAEGNVGGGTGMRVHYFKGGIGTSSRKLDEDDGGYTVGVLVQANYGSREQLRIAGVPVGKEITDLLPTRGHLAPGENTGGRTLENTGGRTLENTGGRTLENTGGRTLENTGGRTGENAGGTTREDTGGNTGENAGGKTGNSPRDGSIIIVAATDAPLLPHQLKPVVKRAAMGLARNGSVAAHTSGDIFIAFSTANSGAGEASQVTSVQMLPNDRITPLFTATVQATEEAIINAMIAAATMAGINGNTVHAIPHDRLRDVLKKYNRLVEE